MKNIKNYIYSIFLVLTSALFLFVVAWYASLYLTKQRIQLEAEAKIQNIKQNKTPFIWDFSRFNDDVIKSTHHYWQASNNGKAIKSLVSDDSKISLNFSGETISARLHNKLIINALSEMSANLMIQFQSELNDLTFYYSPLLKLKGKQQVIDLDLLWSQVNVKTNEKKKSIWGADKKKISSLVLHFSQIKEQLTLESIVLPYVSKNLDFAQSNTDCSARLTNEINHKANEVIVFNLVENCKLPSNYLWLKHYLQNKYPQSIVRINGIKSWLNASPHKINTPYTTNVYLNSVLYALASVLLLWTAYLRFRNKHKARVIEENWYKWTVKQLLFKGVDKLVAPYHIGLNYAFVLLPTLMLLLFMMYLKQPNSDTFTQLPTYFLWAMFQQFLLGYVLAQRVFYNYTQNRIISSVLAAFVFSVLHLPSVTLMLATFIAGCFWAYSWLVFRRFLPLAFSHASLALMFYYLVPERVLYTAKVFQWFWE